MPVTYTLKQMQTGLCNSQSKDWVWCNLGILKTLVSRSAKMSKIRIMFYGSQEREVTLLKPERFEEAYMIHFGNLITASFLMAVHYFNMVSPRLME